MISIILVGRNESWRLTKSLESVERLIQAYPHFDFEVIYVDSKSTDDSIMRAQAFAFVNIFEITGEINSAIARNIGAKESKGEILFFIDADMEIQKNFLKHALNEQGQLKYDYLTGHLDDYFYTIDNQFIAFEGRTYKTKIPSEEQKLKQNGGLCMIKKKVWNSVNGMRNKYRRSQDLDLTIRLKKDGIKIIRIPYLAAHHHTVDYRNEKRMWKELLNGDITYSGMLLRDHIFNIEVIKWAIRSFYTAIILLLFGLMFFNDSNLIIGTVGVFYILILGIRVVVYAKKVKSTKNKIIYFFERFLLQFFLDISLWLVFLFFYPNNVEMMYKKVN